MKKALYKTMYEQIRLDDSQKKNILLEIKEHKRRRFQKRRLPAYIAACLCVLMLSNIVAFAAERMHLGEWIAAELNRLWNTNKNLSEKQIAAYDSQSFQLGQTIPLWHGSLTLEAMLCDNHCFYIPYTFCPESEESLPGLEKEIFLLKFAIKGEKKQFLGGYISLPEQTCEEQISIEQTSIEQTSKLNKTFHGSILLNGSFNQNSIIQIYKPHTDGSLGKPVCELPPAKTINNVKSITYDAKDLREKTNIDFKHLNIKNITLSPLSIYITGDIACGLWQNDTLSIQIERKDGSVVKEPPTGGFIKSGKENDRYRFECCKLFEAPVSFDELSCIRISTKNGKEYRIPIQADESQSNP